MKILHFNETLFKMRKEIAKRKGNLIEVLNQKQETVQTFLKKKKNPNISMHLISCGNYSGALLFKKQTYTFTLK